MNLLTKLVDLVRTIQYDYSKAIKSDIHQNYWNSYKGYLQQTLEHILDVTYMGHSARLGGGGKIVFLDEMKSTLSAMWSQFEKDE